MTGIARHMFPGDNTPEGFYSNYQYILSQQEAEKIYCLKGGPGAGKSTFIRKIGEEMLADGHNVDFMHCSSDSNSLDGIVLRDKKIALVDATSPHIVDPINPGAVDTIVHLGDYWDEAGIRKNRDAVVAKNAELKTIFARAYNYLGAAGKMYDNLTAIYDMGVKKEEMYKLAANIINQELTHKELSPELGVMKKYFASGITPVGFVHFLETLVQGYGKVYLIKAPVGVSGEKILSLFAESALYRGFDVEAYYCPLKPSEKMEHLLIPELGIAFLTHNRFHCVDENKIEGEVVPIDLSKLVDSTKLDKQRHIAEDSYMKMEELLKKGVECLSTAKAEHDHLEENYIPNMDFVKIERLRKEIAEAIRKA